MTSSICQRQTLGVLVLILAMTSGCSGSDGDKARKTGSASCVGTIRVSGHDYEPWPTVQTLKGRVTKHRISGEALACDNVPAEHVQLSRIKGIPASQALFLEGNGFGFKQVYVPASEWGTPPQVPRKVQALLQ